MNTKRSVDSEKEIGKMHIRDLIHELTGGRPYVFVIMSFQSRWDLFTRIREIAEKEFGIACIRADEIKSSGHDLLSKIHELISRAEGVIAEISERTENVFYEIGYAVGIQKVPLLLREKGRQAPADFSGLEVIEYGMDREGVEKFRTELMVQLQFRLNSEIALIRDMLEAPNPQPAYIVASPAPPGKPTRLDGGAYDTRTFGDHLRTGKIDKVE